MANNLVTKIIKVGQSLIYPYKPFCVPRIYLAKEQYSGSVDIKDETLSNTQYQKTFIFNHPDTYFVIKDYQDYVKIEKIIVKLL